MISKFKPVIRSTNIRLMILFSCVGIAMTYLTIYATDYFWEKEFNEEIWPELNFQYDQLFQFISKTNDRNEIEEIAQRMNMDIQINTPLLKWSTKGNLIEVAEINYYDADREYLENGGEIRSGSYEGVYIIHWLNEETQLLLIDTHGQYSISSYNSINKSALINFLIVFALLLFCYLITYNVFSPLKTIQDGIQRFSQGDFKHKIEVNRSDDLGALADKINSMANDIQEMLDNKRQLLFAISHELRTPVTRAYISASMLNDEDIKEEINHDLNEMEAMITGLLEGERLSKNHAILNKETIHIKEMISELIEEKFSGKNVILEIYDENLEIEADKVRLKLMLRNLLENAFRYSNNLDAPVGVKVEKTEGYLFISVKDNGVGIEKKHLQKLTEPFYRIDGSRSKDTGGYGLGMYLCEKIANSHGGNLSIESKFGVGTTVTVSIKV